MATFNTNALPGQTAARSTFTDNIVHLNNAHGISIENGPNHVVRRNQVSSNSRDGIALFSGVTDVLVEANQVYRNAGNGINLRTRANGNIVHANRVARNAGRGIQVSGMSNRILSNWPRATRSTCWTPTRTATTTAGRSPLRDGVAGVHPELRTGTEFLRCAPRVRGARLDSPPAPTSLREGGHRQLPLRRGRRPAVADRRRLLSGARPSARRHGLVEVHPAGVEALAGRMDVGRRL